jgi:hypothetical protein
MEILPTLTLDDILARARPWPPTGVYFLIADRKVVYVGRSIRGVARLLEHQEKLFDSWAFVPCAEQDLIGWERYYTHLFAPPLNRMNMPTPAAPKVRRCLTSVQEAQLEARQRRAFFRAASLLQSAKGRGD